VDGPPELWSSLQRQFTLELASAGRIAAVTWPGEVGPLSHLQQRYTPHLQVAADPDAVPDVVCRLARGHQQVKLTGFSRFDCVARAAAALHERGWEASVTPTALPTTDRSYPAG